MRTLPVGPGASVRRTEIGIPSSGFHRPSYKGFDRGYLRIAGAVDEGATRHRPREREGRSAGLGFDIKGGRQTEVALTYQSATPIRHRAVLEKSGSLPCSFGT
jgi:hypothetical protein